MSEEQIATQIKVIQQATKKASHSKKAALLFLEKAGIVRVRRSCS